MNVRGGVVQEDGRIVLSFQKWENWFGRQMPPGTPIRLNDTTYRVTDVDEKAETITVEEWKEVTA